MNASKDSSGKDNAEAGVGAMGDSGGGAGLLKDLGATPAGPGSGNLPGSFKEGGESDAAVGPGSGGGQLKGPVGTGETAAGPDRDDDEGAEKGGSGL